MEAAETPGGAGVDQSVPACQQEGDKGKGLGSWAVTPFSR